MNIDAYLARIGLAERPAADAAGLETIVRAHRQAIAFENLDILLGRGISLDPDTVFDKIVTRHRGGYCFEQNQLLMGVLASVGFAARPLLARGWLNVTADAPPPPHTHTLSLVSIGGESWIADVGFGGSYMPALRLGDGEAVVTADGATYRMRADPDHGWMVERRGDPAFTDGRATGKGFVPQFSFVPNQVYASDLALSNHWTSTWPDARHVVALIASRALPHGYASLFNLRYSLADGGRREKGEIATAAELRSILADLFAIPLAQDEAARLFEYAERR